MTIKQMAWIFALLAGVTGTAFGEEAKVIALDLFQGKQFTVDAVVGGAKRTFLFNTGEGITMMSPKVARDIGCEPQAISASSAPGAVLVGKARVFPGMILDGNIGMQLMGRRGETCS